jgi:DNA invertase Pin-like site-specific DNA recombinase
MEYITYYRVSTKQQGRSGLGLEAQQQAVQRFLKESDSVQQEYIEIETGKRNNRPKLQQAIQQVQQTGATLLIAKLDRLSRNAAFIFQLRDSQIPFVAADMPDANNLTVGIMAVLADHERQMISERTKAALEALKRRGKQLGTPENLTDTVRATGRLTIQKNAYNDPHNRRAGALALSLSRQGETLSGIATSLNEHGFRTRRNKEFSATQVKRLIERYSQIDEKRPA